MSDAAIELVSVTKRFGEKAVLEDVSLALPRGKTSVLLGPSGTGKSTLLRLATGLLRPDAGQVFALGKEVTALPEGQLRSLRRRFGMLFQDNALFGSLTVFDNIAFPLRHVARHPEPDVKRRVDELLGLVGLEGLETRPPDRLSGGQRKRVALARAIALEPEMVLFDEPTSGLDPQTSAAIDELIQRMQARLGISFLVITHDIHSAAAIAHHVGFLFGGKLVAFGSKEEVWGSQNPLVRGFLDRVPPTT